MDRIQTPIGAAVLGRGEQPEARIETGTTSLFVSSYSDASVPTDEFVSFVRSLRLVTDS